MNLIIKSDFDKNELLKTDSREEFEKAMLQAQQSQYIADKWQKLDQSLYNQSVYYEPNRLAAYYDYESMEFTPEVSAALDIYAEESTTMSEKGEILIYITYTKSYNIHAHKWLRGYCFVYLGFVYILLYM